MTRRHMSPQTASATAHLSWAKTDDVAARMAPAWAAQQAAYEKLADPDGVLSEEERARKAHHYRQAHLQRMRERSRLVREAKKAERLAEEAAEAEALLAEFGDTEATA